MPELRFEFDDSVEHQDRIERILLDLQAEREQRGEVDAPGVDDAAREPDTDVAKTGTPEDSDR